MNHFSQAVYPATLKNRSVLVLGLGDTGIATVRWLRSQGAQVTVADTRHKPPHAELLQRELPDVSLFAGPFERAVFERNDLIVASPGVPLSEPEVAAALARGQDVVGDVELFARTVQSLPNPPRVVAITGSNGKTTVTTMVGEMVQAAGISTAVIGNIGTPVLSALGVERPADVYVLELSSFQLETTHTLRLQAATVLNVTEDHMDRYPDMAAYTAAKARIFAHCDQRVINREDPRSLAMAVPTSISFGLDVPPTERDWGLSAQGWICCGNEPVMALAELPLSGRHNAANAMAALALCDALGVPRPDAVRTLRNFKGLPHRVEAVAQAHGVTYFDDSKGTNVGATVAALGGMTQRVVLIAGGDGKGQDFSPLSPVLSAHARALVLIGRDGPRIQEAVSGSGVPIVHAVDMPDAVRIAASLAQPGDAVLMSPACASFDMFDNYLHRAQVFVKAVQALPGAREVGA
ncbi:MAG: UDP-N-acetylmuramoyl-L-alanine--D-glutamate ligase [Betaproteobacteria bacterium]|nr:UDP-N-acetylmuramoyl-L-alanine--D-glutamate ligase [Betaproteobacteria bacterium]MDE2621952.1 UDP-N-acetylmuramoyl-L-alanine--D-glutamate ligase [Betaproteobacteria bacterium]